jgi:hypothetical protein
MMVDSFSLFSLGNSNFYSVGWIDYSTRTCTSRRGVVSRRRRSPRRAAPLPESRFTVVRARVHYIYSFPYKT